MSIRQGNKVIAGHINYHPDLFDHKWADHLLNDVSWLRADTFSWHYGSTSDPSTQAYEVAYQHLADDISGKSLSSETIAGVTIQFYLADDGHKICPAAQESNVASIYSATGVAWYYIIDTVNERFKLPRTKYGFTGLRNNVGNYVAESLPNISSVFDGLFFTSSYNGTNVPMTSNNGILYNAGNSVGSMHVRTGEGTNLTGRKLGLNVSAGNSAYQDGAPVQQRGTEQYLYFYVGNFTQTALENTAGLNAELFNDKADVSALNTATAHVVTEYQAPTSANNYTWYRKYADGWVEQGGVIAQNSTTTSVVLPVPMADTKYTLVGGLLNGTSSATYEHMNFNTLTTTGFKFLSYDNYGCRWMVCGIAA